MVSQRSLVADSRVSYFMKCFGKMGLIDYNGSVTARPALHAFLQNGKKTSLKTIWFNTV